MMSLVSALAPALLLRPPCGATPGILSVPRAMRHTVATAADEVTKAISSDKVVIFSKSWCPFCMKTKALFEDLSVSYTAVELDKRDDGAEIQVLHLCACAPPTR